MPGPSVFGDAWRECLRSHYMYVIRNRDTVTERTLKGVLHEVGFNDAELAELRVLATAHVDDAGEDFVPDLGVLEKVGAFVSAPNPTVTDAPVVPVDASAAAVEAPPPIPSAPPQIIDGEVVPSGMENPAIAAIAAPPVVETPVEPTGDELAQTGDDAPFDEPPPDDEPPKPDSSVTQLSLF